MNFTQATVFLLNRMENERHLVPEEYISSEAYLNALVIRGMEKRYPDVVDTSKIRKRIGEELRQIENSALVHCLLIVNDYVYWAKEQGILLSPGSMMTPSSLLCYCLGITDIDPVENKLIFERFYSSCNLNQIYLDVDNLKKDQIISYITQKYYPFSFVLSPEDENYLDCFSKYLGCPVTGMEILSKLSTAQQMVIKTDSSFSLNTIPENDKDTYNMISMGKTDNVFQLETPEIQKCLRLLQEVTFDDLLALTSMYRPGLDWFVSQYIDCKQCRTEISYPDEALADILKPTYGIMVYQEQLMHIVHDYAGFDYHEANKARKIMQKKQLKKHPELKKTFMSGSQNLGHGLDSAEKVFEFLYANACYAFPKCHALGQAKITYWHAYIKCHYPEVFTTASNGIV